MSAEQPYVALSRQQDAIANAAADLRIALDAVPTSTVHWAVEDARKVCRSLVLHARTIRTDDFKGASS